MTSQRHRRSRAEVYVHILEACTRQARTQTWLLRELRLKTDSIKDALTYLTKVRLIKSNIDNESGTNTYITTKKGEEALAQYYLLITNYFVGIDKTKKPE